MAEDLVKLEDKKRKEATKIWDRLQERGCCGFNNYTLEWKEKIPKSCCAQTEREDAGGEIKCKKVDVAHERPCRNFIEGANVQLMIVLALIALVNLYLATVTGLSTYRTFHYNEASQNAYS